MKANPAGDHKAHINAHKYIENTRQVQYWNIFYERIFVPWQWFLSSAEYQVWYGSKLVDTLIDLVFLKAWKDFVKNLIVKIVSIDNKSMKNYPACKELIPNCEKLASEILLSYTDIYSRSKWAKIYVPKYLYFRPGHLLESLPFMEMGVGLY